MVAKGLANDQFFNFGEIIVSDTDKVGTLSKIAHVDGFSVFGVDVGIVNDAAAHVNERAVDHTIDTFDGKFHLRGGGVGLEVHADVGSNGIDTDFETKFGFDGMIGSHIVEMVQPVTFKNFKIGVSGSGIDLDTIDLKALDGATLSRLDVVENRRTLVVGQLGTASVFTVRTKDSAIVGVVVVKFASSIDGELRNVATRTDEHTDGRIVVGVETGPRITAFNNTVLEIEVVAVRDGGTGNESGT